MATIPNRESSSEFTVPEVVKEKIAAVVQRTWGARLLSGAILSIAAALVILLAAIVIDWAFVLFDPGQRAMVTYSAGLLMGLIGVGLIGFAGLRRLSPIETARQIDEQIPELQERWSSVSEFSTTIESEEYRGSAAMRLKVAEEAAALGGIVEPKQIRIGRELPIALGCLAGGVALWFFAFLIDAGQTSVLVRRFFAPSAAISLTQIKSETGDKIFPRGENLKLEASVSGRPRSDAILTINREDGTSESHPLELLSGDSPRFAFPLKNLQESFSYRFRSGDGETPWHTIKIAERPSFKRVDFRIVPPAYSKLKEFHQESLPKSVKALQGSKLLLTLESNVALKSLVLEGEDKVNQTPIAGEGNEYKLELELEDTWVFRPQMISEGGLTNEDATRCEIVVYRDQAPVVTIAAPTTDVAVRPDDTVTIAFDAKDDLGITRAELVVYDGLTNEEKELKSIPIPLGKQEGEKSVHAQSDLDLKEFQLKHGSELTYAIRVYDSKESMTTHRPSGSPENEGRVEIAANSENPKESADQNGSNASDANSQAASDQASSDQKNTEQADKSDGEETSPQEGNKSPELAKQDAPQEKRQQAGGGNTWQPKRMGRGEELEKKPNGGLEGAKRPDFHIAKQELDTPPGQCASCARRRIMIDEWAGSYASQVLDKLQLQIDPVLKELKKVLTEAKGTIQPVANRLKEGKEWQAEDSRQIRAGDELLNTADQHVSELTGKSDGTPYAFIGLQLQDILQVHIQPARHHLSDVTLFDSKSNVEDLTASVVHIQRAIDLLEQLTRQYEAVKLNQKLADTMTRIKKMHQIFLEGTFAMLKSQNPTLNPKQREFMELELTDDYLQKLQELLKKKLEIQAELAKILSQDPRLLERFMARNRLEARTLRDQLTLLNRAQTELRDELKAALPPADKPDEKLTLKNRIPHRVAEAQRIAEATAKMLDNYIVWTPLDLDSDQGELGNFKAKLVRMTSTANEFAKQSQDEKSKKSIETGEELYQQLRNFKETVPELLEGGNHPKLPTHIANRMHEAEKLITDISGWIRKEQTIESGNPHLAAEVDQHRITVDTVELSRKLTSLKAQCQGISPELAKSAEAFLATMEEDLVPELESSQVTLNDARVTEAIEHQTAAIGLFTRAEKELD
ncbi:MAG: hypothetical protein KDA36_00500, partial [Planctomycetaceae bacterium]|nr:hypothetical protein [Planctomycetaceae bacterium]